MKKIFSYTFKVFVVTICFILIILFYFSFDTNLLLTMIKKDTNVLDAIILFNSPKGFVFGARYGINIFYQNGGSLRLHGVNIYGRGNIKIFEVDNYTILSMVMDNNNNLWGQETNLELWSYILGFELNNVFDIIENYHLIAFHVEKFPENSRDYKSQYIFNINERTYYLFKGNIE